MENKRVIFLIVLIVSGSMLLFYSYKNRVTAPYDSSLVPFYQLLGKPVKAVDRTLTRVIPVDQLDEKQLGLDIKRMYDGYADKNSPDYIYLNDLIENLQGLAKKSFNYTIYPVKTSIPNAYALPGGVICVTTGLLETVTSEAQLVSIILHEMGHIELSHCFDHVRDQLLTRKISNSRSGKIVDMTLTILLYHAYNKEIEDEADQYAHTMLLETKYNPSAQAQAFWQIRKQYRKYSRSDDYNHADIIRDYQQTHPRIEQRIVKWESESQKWWHHNKTQRRYNGYANLQKRKSLYQLSLDGEWGKK